MLLADNLRDKNKRQKPLLWSEGKKTCGSQWEGVPGGLVVRVWHCHCCSLGLILGWGSETSQGLQRGKKPKQKPLKLNEIVCASDLRPYCWSHCLATQYWVSGWEAGAGNVVKSRTLWLGLMRKEEQGRCTALWMKNRQGLSADMDPV